MITVCIVSYKYGHLVSHAIESVLGQTVKPDKILVVDDAGGDNVAEIVKRYDVRCVTNPSNLGIVKNFQNILFNLVDTDRVLMLGADNWLRQDALEIMSAYDEDIVSTDMALTGENSVEYGRRRGVREEIDGCLIWRFHPGNIDFTNFIHGSSLYNVAKARAVGGYERGNGINSEEDWGLWKRMLKAGATHKHIQDYLLFYRRHRDNFQKI